MVFGLVSSISPSLESLVHLVEWRVSKQALHKWFTADAVRFLQKVFSYICNVRFSEVIAPECLRYFTKILICDSSWWQLVEGTGIASVFNKFGDKNASKPQCKIQLVFDYLNGCFEQFTITNPNVPDPTYIKYLLLKLNKGALLLVDMGYFSIKFFEEIHNKGAYFISKFRLATNIYHPKYRLEMDLLEILFEIDRDNFEFNVLLGIEEKSNLECRMIATKLPKELREQRVKKYKESCKKNRRKPHPRRIQQLAWGLFITNIPEKIMPASHIFLLYSLRWQIELIFKTLKSVLQINFTTVRNNVNRVICELYGKLILAAFLAKAQGAMNNLDWQEYEEEISFDKVVKRVRERAFKIAELAFENFESAIKYFSELLQTCFKICFKEQKFTMTSREKLCLLKRKRFKKIELLRRYCFEFLP